jgi:hypothetical protein
MFINNPASMRGASSILANNENAAKEQQFHHPKLSSNGMKKASFHDNAETPHRNNKSAISKVGQTTQRHRRAFGDISNRKVTGGGGGASGGGKDNSLVLNRTSSSNLAHGSLKSTANKLTTSNLTHSSKVQYPTLPPSAPSALTNNGQGGINSLRQPRQRSSSNIITSSKINAAGKRCDVFPSTTRWANDDAIIEDTRSPFYLVSEKEWNMVSDLREEFSTSTQKESEERIRLEIERDEQLFMEKIRDINDEALATSNPTSNVDGLNGLLDGLHLLEDKLPWEVDDGGFDPTEERRLSGNDPCSLWGDISNW